MNYTETINYLFTQLPIFQRVGKAAYKANLNNTIELDNYFGNPHNNFKSIHIAGTNGKGSVSHLLASVFKILGFKTGLYTSPHLKDFRERIKINGKMIPEYEVVDFVENNIGFFTKLKPSFFEITVSMAFRYFAQQQVDIAIIETGLGGRLDSTNIINPLLSVITNISKDHTEFLGDSIEKIAIEKAGIIKPNIPVVIGESNKITEPVFHRFAKKNDAEIYLADKNLNIKKIKKKLDYQVFNIRKSDKVIYNNLHTDLLGNYQGKNIITALQAIEILNDLGYNISNEIIRKAFKSVNKTTGLTGRWHIIGNNPLIICDTGHNEAGIKSIVNQLNEQSFNKLHFIFGAVSDKNIDKILLLLPKKAKYYFTKANIPRALDEKILKFKADKFNLNGDSYATVKSAFDFAKKSAGKNDLIFIGGSTYIVAEII